METIIAINSKAIPSKSDQDDLCDKNSEHYAYKQKIIADISKYVFLF